MPTTDAGPPLEPEEPPPIGGSWRRLYSVVLIALAVEVVILYWFTRAFS
ncbi:MAG TPA: hypothetical protein VMS56_12130 [Thermoanaerobaculia bacterium]|nr:hypothetical protein [Thermoanaerobaculia bacterium]